jgi:hypothetical protein
MIWFIGTSAQLHSIMTAHNQWRSKTRSVPYCTTSVFSSTVTNDNRRIPAHTLNCLDRRLSDESTAFYNFHAAVIKATASKSSIIVFLECVVSEIMY